MKEEDIDSIWNELGMDKGAAVGLCVRSIRACPGTTFCTMGKQDALGMGMTLRRYPVARGDHMVSIWRQAGSP